MSPHSPRRRHLLLAGGGALVVALALIGASRLSADSQPTDKPVPTQAGEVAGAGEITALLDGIPQHGTVLGKPDAPVTLVEYADFQCPYCAQWALGTLPALVRDYVRAGKLRIEFRGLAFLGPDSETALRAALAAGRQDGLWNVVELLYANQGAENSGWVTEDLLGRIAASVPGLDPEQFQSDRELAAIGAEMAKAETQAQASGVRGTPAFEIGRTGGALHSLRVTSLEPGQFRQAVGALLAG